MAKKIPLKNFTVRGTQPKTLKRVVMRRAAHSNPAVPRPGEPGYPGSEIYQTIVRQTIVSPESIALSERLRRNVK